MKITARASLAQTVENTGNNISALVRTLSAIIRDYQQALSGNLTLGDNVTGQFNTITVETQPLYANGKFQAVVVPWLAPQVKAPQSVLVGQVVQPASQNTVLTTGHSVAWSYNSTNSTINISYITGLLPKSKYTITLESK